MSSPANQEPRVERSLRPVGEVAQKGFLIGIIIVQTVRDGDLVGAFAVLMLCQISWDLARLVRAKGGNS